MTTLANFLSLIFTQSPTRQFSVKELSGLTGASGRTVRRALEELKKNGEVMFLEERNIKNMPRKMWQKTPPILIL